MRDDLNARDTALALLARGLWPVVLHPVGAEIPTRDGPRTATGKEPIGQRWGAECPTEACLLEIFKRHPDAGVGVRLGPESGVIDLEGDGPEAEESLLKLFGGELVNTLGWSSRRGAHRLFRWNERLNVLGKIKTTLPQLPGLEIRSGFEGKQAQSACPPTVGEDGLPRQWNGCDTIAELPEAALAFLENAPAGPSHAAPHEANGAAPRRLAGSVADPAASWFRKALENEAGRVATAREGTRHNTLLTAARTLGGMLHHGYLTEADVSAELAHAARRAGLDEAESAETIRDGLSHGKAGPLPWPDKLGRPAGESPPCALGSAANPQATTSTNPDFVSFVSNPPEPRPIREELRRVPALATEMIPGPLRGWLADIAWRMQCSPEFPVVGAVVSLAALVGRKVAIRPKRKDDWTVVPNLWGAVVGRPGIMKSPALEEAMRPLKRLAAEAGEANAAAIAEYNIKILIGKARVEAAKDEMKRAAKKSGASDEDLRTLAQAATATDEGAGPVLKRYIVNDSSVEKLGEILRDNPNGVLLFRDELTGFLRTLDKPGRESDRAFHLEGWSGLGAFTYDRIGRGIVHIPSVCESILGGIQPGPLVRYMRAATSGDGESDDGLFQRFQVLVYPDHPGKFDIIDEWPDATEKNRAYAIFRFLDVFDPAQIGATLNEEGGIPYLRFTDEAQALFYEWWEDLERKIRSGQESPALESHLAKYRSLMPSLALLFHLIDAAVGRAVGPVSHEAAALAAAWCDLLEAHARRIYELGADGDMEPARHLADRIRRRDATSPFRVRQIVRKGWSRLDSNEDVERAVAVLEDHGWLYGVEIPSGAQEGRPTTEYHINMLLLGGKT